MAARLPAGGGVPSRSAAGQCGDEPPANRPPGARLHGLSAIGGRASSRNLRHFVGPARRTSSRKETTRRPLPTRLRVLEREAPPQQMRSSAEQFIEEALLAAERDADDDSDADAGADANAGAAPRATSAQLADLRARLAAADAVLARADAELDDLYARAFSGVCEVAVVEAAEEAAGGDDSDAGGTTTTRIVAIRQPMSARLFSALSRDDPAAAEALLAAVQADAQAAERWRALQPALATARLSRGRAEREADALRARAEDAVRGRAMAAEGRLRGDGAAADSGGGGQITPATSSAAAEIVLVCGFESFNVALYRQVARRLLARSSSSLDDGGGPASSFSRPVRLTVYSDRDLADDASGGRRDEVAAALARADCAFCSLLFDYDGVEWLRPRLARVPQVLVFESALELMSCTHLGGFKMGGGGGGGGGGDGDAPAAAAAAPKKPPPGPPPAVKKVLSLFSSGREEDRMVGYLAFLKAGPRLLKFVPGKAARDLRSWLTVYGFWNQGGAANVEAMFEYLAREYLGVGGGAGGAAASAGKAEAAAAPAVAAAASPAAANGPGLLSALGRFVAETTRGARAPSDEAGGAAPPQRQAAAAPSPYAPPPPLETPATGCLHPDYQPAPAGASSPSPSASASPYFATPADYVLWYAREGPLRDRLPPWVVEAARGAASSAAVAASPPPPPSSPPCAPYAPVVAVLLYRKHVITEQPYIPQLVRLMESEGVIPVPIFINGVEAHTVVRDALTSAREQRRRARAREGGARGASSSSSAAPAAAAGGLWSRLAAAAAAAGAPRRQPASSAFFDSHYHDYHGDEDGDDEEEPEAINPTLSPRAVPVDAVVNTIGFPLVGGPAGTMEGGRQAEVAAAILRSKGVPYVVAAPLLIQSMESWARDGVAGLQSVVLYSLPEIDGATDAIPLGGLVGDDIFLAPERVRRLARRLARWHALRVKPASARRVAVLTYGFPPGVGAVGTAALLNVPKSLVASLKALQGQGYDLGGADLDAMGEAGLRADVAGVASSALIGAQRRRAMQQQQRPEGSGAGGGDGASDSPPLPSPAEVAAYLARLRAEAPGAYRRLRDAAAGEALVAALRLLTEEPRAVASGPDAVRALARRAAAAAASAAADGAASSSGGGSEGVSAGVASAAGVALATAGVLPVADEVSAKQLAAWLRFPPEWGPSEWGPLPYLPDDDALVARMERQWGDLQKHATRNAGGPLLCTQRGGFLVAGLQLGNVFLGVQPQLGVEGDPMRLLFERDLTPHPQYAAFYRWLAEGGWGGGGGGGGGAQQDGRQQRPQPQPQQPADAVLTFGTHGTQEWLPGAPLGTTALSWPDALLGDLPNVYLYVANNPSESIVAKRRGYGTLVSHNVPAYGRAGLYKHLAALKGLLQELREADAGEEGGGADGGASSSSSSSGEGVAAALRVPVADALRLSGLQQDLPWLGEAAELRLAALPPGTDRRAAAEAEAATAAREGRSAAPLTPDNVEAEAASPLAFSAYCSRLYAYLLELESRLFSEGLHAIGGDGEEEEEEGEQQQQQRASSSAASTPSVAPATLAAYLQAYFGEDRLPSDAAMAVAKAPRGGAGVEAAREALERAWSARGGTAAAAAVGAAAPAAPPGAAEVAETPGAAAGSEAASPDPASLALARQAVALRDALALSARAEVAGLLTGLSGGHVPAGLGGDLLRDGSGVLPTGRNIYATDPYRMPSPAAEARGARAAAAVLAQHRAANGGAWPEAVTVNLWGLDAIKTRGESVAMVLHFVGARVVKEGTGRVARFELVPLDELTFDDPLTGERGLARPRVDVVCSMSGIFRDAFQNVVDLLDDLFRRAAEANEEDVARNYVRKHALELMGEGGGGVAAAAAGATASPPPTKIDAAAAARRIFSNPAGDYGSMVTERVGQGNWQDASELGATWASRNAFSYGRGAGERGVARPEVLEGLLSKVDRVVQCVDSVEVSLGSTLEYFGNTGGLLAASRTARAASLKRRADAGDGEAAAALSGASASAPLVACSIVESFAAEPTATELDAALRREYRTTLLNPRWAEAMVAQGSGGAFDVGQRFTALIGWGGTSGFADQWAWDQAAQTYAFDEAMASRLRRANPQAFKNVLARCLEAAGRGLWDADAADLQRLRELYAQMDDELEGVAVAKAAKAKKEEGGA